jgi:hypothetical protein
MFARGGIEPHRQYQPASELEDEFYKKIDKNIWPDDVRNDINLYRNSRIAWVGVVDSFTTDFSNPEHKVIILYVKHHYYNWIEHTGSNKKLINLSPGGEGYFVCYYMLGNEIDPINFVMEFVGEVIISYGSPIGIVDNDFIEMSTDYLRIVDKEDVNLDFLDYGRGGYGFQ